MRLCAQKWGIIASVFCMRFLKDHPWGLFLRGPLPPVALSLHQEPCWEMSALDLCSFWISLSKQRECVLAGNNYRCYRLIPAELMEWQPESGKGGVGRERMGGEASCLLSHITCLLIPALGSSLHATSSNVGATSMWQRLVMWFFPTRSSQVLFPTLHREWEEHCT